MLHQTMEHVFNRCPSQYIIHTSSAVSKFTHSPFPLCMPATDWHGVPIRTIKRFLYVLGVMLCRRGERTGGWYFQIMQKVNIINIYAFLKKDVKFSAILMWRKN